jgi:hypothetical protein
MSDDNTNAPAEPKPATPVAARNLDGFHLADEEHDLSPTPLDQWWEELNADPDLVESWEMGPPSDPPDVRNLNVEDSADKMVEWFEENFEDPAHDTPWDGGYVYIWGGPYHAHEVLEETFAAEVDEQAIKAAIKTVELRGFEWAPAQSRMQPEISYDPVIDAKQRLLAALRKWRVLDRHRGWFKLKAKFSVRDVALLLLAHSRLRASIPPAPTNLPVKGD